MIKIGFPRGLLYYDYFPFWESFFKGLNVEVITSPLTNKDILNSGIQNSVDEACLPVKIFHGHVNYLKDKVDYIFIPRYVSLYKREYNCPKHLGIANMILHSMDNIPPLISPKVEMRNGSDFRTAAFEVGKVLSNNYFLITKSYKASIGSNKNHLEWLKTNIIPKRIENKASNSIKILILGHPYNIYDEFVNMGILSKLVNENIEILFAEEIQDEEIRIYTDLLPKRIFWSHGKRIIGAAFSLIDKEGIDGIIYLSAFGCGLDSVLIHIVEEEANKNNVPIMTMTLDEQTGEAGFNTRLEAFLDMMKWRANIENNFSSSR